MASPRQRKGMWMLWIAATLALAACIGLAFEANDAQAETWVGQLRSLLLPGATSHGHYQIELACDGCHGDKAFNSAEALQASCLRCHGAELKAARDSHPQSKFTDPRNAERAALLDATRCVTCHVEHRPGLVNKAGATLPRDYCSICHKDVASDRPSHLGMSFDTCGNSGCHNFHDNRALYEDFLLKHAAEPALKTRALLPARDFLEKIEELTSYPAERYPLKPLGVSDADGRRGKDDELLMRDWLETAHAQNGVNCSACHESRHRDGEAKWVERPTHEACKGCHEGEVGSWLAGKHGMRVAAGLSPMRPELARQPMQAEAQGRLLGCNSCHGSHRFDARRAAVSACVDCHADTHTRNYASSKHSALWQQELRGEIPSGGGVSCASCHLPRVEHRSDELRRVLVQHNQNHSLRPSDKMLRPVCLNCHGMQFALDALADRSLVARNFNGKPAARVESVRMTLEADARARASRDQARRARDDDS